MSEFQISLMAAPEQVFLMRVMSECTYCSKMCYATGQLTHAALKPRHAACELSKGYVSTCQFKILFWQVFFSNNSLNSGVFHLLINSHRRSPFHCWEQFTFEALLSRTNFSLRREHKHFPSASPDKDADICASPFGTNFPPLANFPAGAHIIVFLTNNNCWHMCFPIKLSALLHYCYHLSISYRCFYCSTPYACMEHKSFTVLSFHVLVTYHTL